MGNPGEVDELLIQGVRDWISTSTGLDRTRIVAKDIHIERPELPYITVDLSLMDDTIGTDELEKGIDVAGNPTVKARGFRLASVTLNGYGVGSAQLLMRASLSLRLPSILELLCAAQFSVRPTSPLIDLSALASNKIEKRFAKDFQIQYLLRDTVPEQLVEATLFEFDMTFETDPGPSDLIETLTINC